LKIKKVEAGGIEPPSEMVNQPVSTCLVCQLMFAGFPPTDNGSAGYPVFL